MPIPAIPIIVVLLGGAAYLRRDKAHGVMTPERTKIFNAALAGGMQDPENLDKLAKTFAGEGLPEQAALLRQRAALKRLPNEVKLARRQIWRKAIASKNKAAVQRLAAAYDAEGCTSAAMRLREIASGLPDNLPAPESQIAGEAVEAPAAEEENAPEESEPGSDAASPEDQAAE
jgi:hypothetical protein